MGGKIKKSGTKAHVPETEGVKQISIEITPEEKSRILNLRADAIRNKPAENADSGSGIEVLEFLLGSETYAIDVLFIREVVHLKQLTVLPCTPRFILGVFNVRGRITSVVDLRKFFSLPEKGITNLNRVIIVQKGETELGILADDLVGTAFIRMDALQSQLPAVVGTQNSYIQGVSREKTILLDTEKFLADEKILINEQVL